MDFGYCPGITAFDKKIAGMFEVRANTKLIKIKHAKNVDEFIEFLDTDTTIVTRPVQDILLGAHGTAKGQLSVTFTDKVIQGIIRSKTPYLVLEFAEAQGLGKLEPATIKTDSNFHIKGCTIGQSKPYVDKLKKVLGVNITITAPKLFQQIAFIDKVGYVEGLGHDFFVTSLTPIPTRPKMIKAFQDKKLKFFDGTTDVPDNLWKKWLPQDVSEGERTAKFNVKLKPTIKFSSSAEFAAFDFKDDIGFVYRKEPTPVYTNSNWTGTSIPTDSAAKKAFLEPLLKADKDYDPTKTDFPIHMWYGFSNVADYLNDWEWTINNPRPKVLQAQGNRYFARIIVPACKLSGKFNELLYNFYPVAGAAQAARTGISQTDTNFYLIV